MDKPVNKVAVVVEITSDVVCPWCVLVPLVCVAYVL